MTGISRSSHSNAFRSLQYGSRLSVQRHSRGPRHASNHASPHSSGHRNNGQDDAQNVQDASALTQRQKEFGSNSDGDLNGEHVKGAMTRRLEQMSEAGLEEGGLSARKAFEEAGFGHDLRLALEQKIADANFRSEHAAALSHANVRAGAPKHARDTAAAQPWSGNESIGDASLRMLNDAYKPLKGGQKSIGGRGPPRQVDTGRPKSRVGTGVRLASAREKVSVYSNHSQEPTGMSEEERERFRKEMKARFEPAGRIAPASVQGLANLANQRIEDAIARGQFKNLPNKGQRLERDHNADSPFIDTTQYFMNRIIKKQELVPPWIEKQQEVVSTATAFRRRLRSDWKRHVARVIASRGGSLESQVQLAEEYAFAESLESPSKQQMVPMTAVDTERRVSQITVTGQLTTSATHDTTRIEEEIKVLEHTFNDDGSLKPVEETVTISTEQPFPAQATSPPAPERPSVPPFRDPQWEQTESSYHNLAIQELNQLTRSYNLMAPNLAKKPYFSLERELQTCFSDVAPQIASAIRERAYKPKVKGVEAIGHSANSLLDRFSMDKASQVHDERKPQYGFKEFWRDLFASKAS